MNTRKKVFLGAAFAVGLSLASYIAVAQTGQSGIPSFEVATTTGPMLGSCSDTTCTDPLSCENACLGVWNATVSVNPGFVQKNGVITITLRATDPSGVQGVQARVKDPSGKEVSLITMYDDGAHHDASRLDGLWGEAWNVGNNVDGTYLIDILMSDRLGNTSESAAAGAFIIGEAPCASDFDCATGQKCCVSLGMCSVDECSSASDCDDANAATVDMCDTTQCPAGCTHTVITDCIGGDGYCPVGCVLATDSDCVDTTPPVVSFADPSADGQEITSSPRPIAVEATDAETAIQRVEFYYGGVLQDTQYAPGVGGLWTWIWDLSGVPNTAPGTTQIQARAYNAASLTATASRDVIINIPVPNNAPTAAITAPLDGSTVSGLANIVVQATDDNSVTSISVFHTTAGLIGTATAHGTSVTATFGWNATATATAYVKSGISQYAMNPSEWKLPFIPVAQAAIVCSTCTSTTYYNQELYARAYDADGLFGESVHVNVTTPITSSYSCNCYDDGSSSSSAG